MMWNACSPSPTGVTIARITSAVVYVVSAPAGRWMEAAWAKIFVAKNATNDCTAGQTPLAQPAAMPVSVGADVGGPAHPLQGLALPRLSPMAIT